MLHTLCHAAAPGNRFVGNRGIPIDNSLGSNADGPTVNDGNDADVNAQHILLALITRFTGTAREASV